MKGSDFIFDSVQHLYYKCDKANFRHSGSCVASADWIKKKIAISPKKKDDKCFKYAVTIALNYGEIESLPERVLKINYK